MAWVVTVTPSELVPVRQTVVCSVVVDEDLAAIAVMSANMKNMNHILSSEWYV